VRFVLLLLLASCVSSANMRAVEDEVRGLSYSLTRTADDISSLADSVEDVEKTAGKYEALGSKLGEIAGQVLDTKRQADAAANTAGKAAADAERLESHLQGESITGNPLVDLLITGGMAAATAYVGVNKHRDRKYVAAAPITIAPPGKTQT